MPHGHAGGCVGGSACVRMSVCEGRCGGGLGMCVCVHMHVSGWAGSEGGCWHDGRRDEVAGEQVGEEAGEVSMGMNEGEGEEGVGVNEAVGVDEEIIYFTPMHRTGNHRPS